MLPTARRRPWGMAVAAAMRSLRTRRSMRRWTQGWTDPWPSRRTAVLLRTPARTTCPSRRFTASSPTEEKRGPLRTSRLGFRGRDRGPAHVGLFAGAVAGCTREPGQRCGCADGRLIAAHGSASGSSTGCRARTAAGPFARAGRGRLARADDEPSGALIATPRSAALLRPPRADRHPRRVEPRRVLEHLRREQRHARELHLLAGRRLLRGPERLHRPRPRRVVRRLEGIRRGQQPRGHPDHDAVGRSAVRREHPARPSALLLSARDGRLRVDAEDRAARRGPSLSTHGERARVSGDHAVRTVRRCRRELAPARDRPSVLRIRADLLS